MKTILKFISLAFVVTNLFMACAPVLYSNVGQNVPLLKEKGDFSAQVALAESDGGEEGGWLGRGVGIQGAYAVSEKIAAIGSFYSMAGVDDDDTDWQGNGSYFELGAGLYGGQPEKKFLYEVFLGLGSGSIKNSSVNANDYINVGYLKPFVQPSLAFSTKYFDMALTPRIAFLSYTKKDDYRLANTEEYDPISYFEENNNQVLFEPGILFRGGFPSVKLELQINYSTVQGTSVDGFDLNNKWFNSIGLRFLIPSKTLENGNE
jgi:hypothetical protein